MLQDTQGYLREKPKPALGVKKDVLLEAPLSEVVLEEQVELARLRGGNRVVAQRTGWVIKLRLER